MVQNGPSNRQADHATTLADVQDVFDSDCN